MSDLDICGAEKGDIIECWVLRMPSNPRTYLITNGMNMGRWTVNFGAHCLADLSDNKKFVQNHHEMSPTSEILKVTINCTFEAVEDKN